MTTDAGGSAPAEGSSAADGPLDVTILDVGHGNSAIVRDGHVCSVVDAAPRSVVKDELNRWSANASRT